MLSKKQLLVAVAVFAVVLCGFVVECGVIEDNETSDTYGIRCRQRLGDCTIKCGPLEKALIDSDVDCPAHMTCSEYYGVKIYPTERHCAMVGGICVQKDSCAEGTSKQGLCRKSQHMGVECCYAVIPRPAPCQQLTGACMARCPQALVRPEATDCPSNTKCCTLTL